MSEGFWYLATPYRAHPDGFEKAFLDAALLSARLIDIGFDVYSPIVHSHPIAQYVASAPPQSDFWLDRQLPMMRAARGIIVGKLPGWEVSIGIKFELAFFCGGDVRSVDPAQNVLIVEAMQTAERSEAL